ncbi:fimbrial assembly protein [Salinibacterium sp. NG253]|uniref:fimbrial assembly protein n=1 Tax=Salinibacterium sp. NG253 TaxID=2792039 RepID=UPI0018CDC3A6|nr:fimbrial assembly protein [Salinibacterium sp. NG253]MBH0116439.1 fimbrial assembly protein [Salinibacterium sp. NG253]
MSDDKKKAPKARKELKVPTAYPPYVSLLPPEVGQKKAAGRARGRAIFVAIIAIGVVILASAGMNLYALQRYLALENARSLTQSLITQQGEYNDVRVAGQMVQSATSARIFATSTEVSVEDLITALGKKLPDGAAGIVSYSFETATPLQEFGTAVSVLEPGRLAQLAMEINFASVTDADKWLRSSTGVTGVMDTTLVTAEREENGTYTANFVIYIDEEALVHRFDGVEDAPEAEAEDAEAEPTPAPTETPEATSTPVPTEEATEEGSGS